MEVHPGIVQICCSNLSFLNSVPVNVEPRFVLSTSHNGRHMLPDIGTNDARWRQDGSVGLIIRSGRFNAEGAFVVGHIQVPALCPTGSTERNDARSAELLRVNPS